MESASGTGFSIADLARHLPPIHDLETLTVWLSLAHEADISFDGTREAVDIQGSDGIALRFDVPKVELNAVAVADLQWEA